MLDEIVSHPYFLIFRCNIQMITKLRSVLFILDANDIPFAGSLHFNRTTIFAFSMRHKLIGPCAIHFDYDNNDNITNQSICNSP